MDGCLSLQGLRALVVEDSYFIADDLKRVLEDCGARDVEIAGSIDAALRRLVEGGFDVALLDLNLRGEMAFAVADELLRRRVPFGFVSGYEGSAIPGRFARVPNWCKPYDDREIVAGVRRLWARPGVRGSADRRQQLRAGTAR